MLEAVEKANQTESHTLALLYARRTAVLGSVASDVLTLCPGPRILRHPPSQGVAYFALYCGPLDTSMPAAIGGDSWRSYSTSLSFAAARRGNLYDTLRPQRSSLHSRYSRSRSRSPAT